jgi:hypothetical protein
MARVIEQAGVSVAPTGSTGVQVNEFEAAIKSVTSATTVGAVFVYSTRNDSDGGAWRKKARGSWYYEDLNTATRGGRREFPSVALIVADNAAGSETITIYDLDDPAMPMWLVFQMGGASESSRNFSGRAGENANSLFALNGRVMWGLNADLSSGGFCIADFANDAGRRHGTLAAYTEVGRVLSERNSAILPQRMVGGLIVNSTVNDVAATIVEGAEIGALGLPIPTVGVATDGGVSVIHPNGDVYNQTYSVAINNESNHIQFDKSNGLYWVNRSGAVYLNYLRNALYATSSAAPDKVYHTKNTGASVAGPTMLGGSTAISSVASMGDDFAAGSTNGLSVVKHNDGNPDEGAVAYVTSEYNTGYMLGDIRFAGLANHWHNDRSVKGNNLTENGSISNAVVATDAELRYYYGFSASNYLSRAYDADFDFGTGDFSITLWCNLTSTSSTEAIVARYAPNSASPDWLLAKHSTDTIKFFTDGANAISTATAVDGRWVQLCVLRRGSRVEIYVDGKLDGSGTNAADLTNTSAVLGIGIIPTSSVSNPLASTSSLSLVRISATAPTPQQVKDIYEAEAPLFRAGAKCLLQSDHPSLPNTVLDLAHDKSTDLLSVSQYATISGNGISRFRGLEMVDTFQGDDYGWDVNSTNLVATSGGVSAYGRTSGTGGLVLDLPAIDVRGDINTADTKLPDDGKLHFTGVTTDATVTTIGQIPVAANEVSNVKVRVNGCKYKI